MGIVLAVLLSAFPLLLLGRSFESSALVFIAISYLPLIYIFIIRKISLPSRDSFAARGIPTFTDEEWEILSMSHVFLRYRAGAEIFMHLINGIRLFGLFWGLAAILNGRFYIAAFCLAYFFAAGHELVGLSPYRFYLPDALKGRQPAVRRLTALKSVSGKLGIIL